MTGFDKYLRSGRFIFNMILLVISLVCAILVAYVLDDLWNRVSVWYYGISLVFTIGLYVYASLSSILDMLYIREKGNTAIAPFVSKKAKQFTEEDIQNEKRR